MKSLSDGFIDGVNSRLWAEASAEFGSSFAVPSDRVWRIGEYVRGLYVLQVFVERKGGSLASGVSELRALSVSDSTIDSLVADGVLGGVAVSGDRPLSRKISRLFVKVVRGVYQVVDR